MMAGTYLARILFVEPDGAQAAAIQRTFADVPHTAEITVVEDLDSARALIKNGPPPDLVLAVPCVEKEPTTTLLKISADPAPWPLVLLVSDASRQADIAEGLASGAFDYIVLDAATLADLPHRAQRLIAEWAMAGQQREAEIALREKEAFNFALFQHNPAAMVVVDHGGRVIKSNLARRSQDNQLPALGAPLYDPARGETESQLADILHACIARHTVQQVSDLAWGRRWLNVVMAPLPSGAVVIIEDITRRKQAEAEAEQRQRQLIQADKMVALGNLVSGVAHEVSNPNNAMILSTTALKRLCDDMLPVLDRLQEQEGDFDVGPRMYSDVRGELPDLINVLGRAAQRIKLLIDDLKAYARKGPETLHETVQVNAVLDAATTLMHPLIRKSTHRFTLEKAPDLPTVAGNAQRLEQVVINLLSNACQALRSPQAAITAATRWDARTEEVVIEVRDEGVGIPAGLLEKITEPFFTTRHDDGGTGLGLSISKSIVEHHKGQLLFASEPGKGTVATIRLPARADHAARKADAERGGARPS
ncbi:MAG: hypothetical protein K8T26_20195 [Lentisphaerae bacterium]|nr:hypothetical protein [Lentisphaerota bacterium]